MAAAGINAKYEEKVIAFEQPAKARRYTPDFVLPNGIVIETKGYFVPEDRNKMVWVTTQHPGLDVRMVFTNSSKPLYRGSKTTYADWCAKHGIECADKLVPRAWLTEPKCPAKLAAIEEAARPRLATHPEKDPTREPNRRSKRPAATAR